MASEGRPGRYRLRGQNDCEKRASRNSPSMAVALNCGMGSSSLNAEVNAFERLQIVRGRNSSHVPHETTTPSSTHPRVSTRTSLVRLLSLLPSYFHSRHEPSHACSTHKTRPDLQPMPSCTLRHMLLQPRVPPQHHSSPIASVAPAASFKSLY